MTDKTDRVALKALAIAAGMIFILFVGLFVGYLWGAMLLIRTMPQRLQWRPPTTPPLSLLSTAKGKRLGS